MDYSYLVPSRELCQRMKELGICQDGPELWYVTHSDENNNYTLRDHESAYQTKSIIAPTLPRMMSELGCDGYAALRRHANKELYWHSGNSNYEYDFEKKCETREVSPKFDKHIPNAIAKALIAIKESHV